MVLKPSSQTQDVGIPEVLALFIERRTEQLARCTNRVERLEENRAMY